MPVKSEYCYKSIVVSVINNNTMAMAEVQEPSFQQNLLGVWRDVMSLVDDVTKFSQSFPEPTLARYQLEALLSRLMHILKRYKDIGVNDEDPVLKLPLKSFDVAWAYLVDLIQNEANELESLQVKIARDTEVANTTIADLFQQLYNIAMERGLMVEFEQSIVLYQQAQNQDKDATTI